MTWSDFDWFAGLYADPDVTLYLGGQKTRAQVEEMFHTRIIDYYAAHPGLGIWQTVERASGRPVGFHLINHIHGERIILVGYGLAKDAWGKGYATEMARAVLRYGFAELGLPFIAGMTDLRNTASLRVLEKIGLERQGERAFSHPVYAAAGPLAWFEGHRDRWIERMES
jgi:RimJ/RimL family protein N-acetyltransferase